MDAVEKDDLDIDTGRHLDDRLILFGSFDVIFGDGIGGISCALAKAAGQYVAAPLTMQPVIFVVSNLPFLTTERAGPVMRNTTGSGSLWLATPTEASTPTMTFAGA